jgi:excisionase family DNA binding protein
MIGTDEILNAQEAAQLLGAHVETIRRMARKGKIPAFKIGKDWRFRRSLLLAWSETNPGIKTKPRLLVIDDDRGVRRLMHRYFTPMGYLVTGVANGREGLQHLESHAVDLVLLDLKMPVMSGPAFIREMRKTHADTPVIIVSGYPDSQLMLEASHFGPLMLIAKPIDKKMLFSAVNLALNGTRPDSDMI